MLVAIGVGLVALQRLLELVLSRRNERRLRVRGAVERGGGHYPVIVGLHALWLVGTLVEGLLRPGLPSWWPAALAAFLLAQPLRYWAILSLGERWSTRILVLPGEELVRRGPYRYLRHPNYLAVVVEIFAFPMIFGAWGVAVVFSLLNAVVLAVRIREEERALSELAKPAGRR
ncbi:membrane protein [Rubrobacter xylanophilus]|uniref:Membrane protein n=1 Tax=Rubrobacter xylanophilus TaxID=49319 RepID=A0A510HF14_9ACTN|nr:isoprenylcysteine carboxylmethyltransferase family protein [Rubrobacter xylanophilus]BBL78539.1 membrane protein [Rubrobacter xylanophilus]